jgi:hypothetical protein
LVLAERVCDEASQIGEWSERSRVLAIVVRAFACAGAVDRATETIERLSEDPPAFFLANEYEVKPVVDAVAGLWPCAPDLAGRLVDDLLGDARFLRRETSVRSVEELAQLRAVVGRHDIERGARIEARLHTVEDASHDYRERALRALLIASTDPTAVRHRLDELTAQMDDSVESAFFAEPWVAIALAYDVLGDHEAARGIARRGVFGGEASRVLTALAAHASHLPDGPIISPLLGGSGTLFTTALRLAALSPSPSGPDLPRARALLAEALTPDGWHQALPVMAAIDPDAVLPVRDVVLEHLGLATDRS